MILTRGVGNVNAWGNWAGSYCGAILLDEAWLRTGAESQKSRRDASGTLTLGEIA